MIYPLLLADLIVVAVYIAVIIRQFQIYYEFKDLNHLKYNRRVFMFIGQLALLIVLANFAIDIQRFILGRDDAFILWTELIKRVIFLGTSFLAFRLYKEDDFEWLDWRNFFKKIFKKGK